MSVHIVLAIAKKKPLLLHSNCIVIELKVMCICISAGLLGSARFTGSSQNYSTLLLEEEARLLYVGGRGALYALNTSNVSTPVNLTVSAKTLQTTDHHVIAAVNKETANPISQVSSHFISVKGGQTNNSLKQIEQIPLCSSNFMGIGLNAPGVYARVTEESQNSVTQPEN